MTAGDVAEVMLEVCGKLKPVSGYRGIGVAESPDSSIESYHVPVVDDWAQRFPGLELEVDCPTISFPLVARREGR
jgi:hypothetical protein